MAKKKIEFQIILKPEKEGGYTVYVPELPGCITYGKTIDESYLMAKDAIKAYLFSLKKHKEKISLYPNKTKPLITTLEIEYV
jgi:predicted RNase H-like HicB family nuclease